MDLSGRFTAFASVDNPTRSARVFRDNTQPPLGRSALLGVEIRR